MAHFCKKFGSQSKFHFSQPTMFEKMGSGSGSVGSTMLPITQVHSSYPVIGKIL